VYLPAAESFTIWQTYPRSPPEAGRKGSHSTIRQTISDDR